MASGKYRINPSGYREVLRDYSTQQECLNMAQLFAANAQTASGGSCTYYCDVIAGLNRAHARATTATIGSAWQERLHHYLSKSVPSKGQKRR